MLPWRQRVDISTTTDERVYRVNELSREEQIKLSIVKMDSQLKAQKPSAIDIKNSLMLNLIDLHLSLLFTAEAVEKRIPIMYANCMRAQPSVACPRP